MPVSGTKAYYGHPLRASGAIEAAICALAIRHGWAPGTVNLDQPDPQALELLPGLLSRPLESAVGAALSVSFGFGGLNAALAVSRP
jgi:3-oxoacyl-[acyl-carrier-protein] synthase II